MPEPITTVISTAGLGSRLGLDVPKGLVEVGGTPILARQLAALPDGGDVVVVVGHRSDLVVELLRGLGSGARIVHNPDYATTGTAASVALGAADSTGWVLALDGDVLVREGDLRTLTAHSGACLAVTPAHTAAPVCARLAPDGAVLGLSQEHATPWEWPGLARIPADVARGLGTGHIYRGLGGALPMPSLPVDCVEIDDRDDLLRAEAWVAA